MSRICGLAVLIGVLVLFGSIYGGAGAGEKAGEEALKPPEGGDTRKKIDRLIGKLASDDFNVREQAEKDLKEIGEPARKALEEALESDDDEVRWRAARVLRELGRKGDSVQKKSEDAQEPQRRRRSQRSLPIPPRGLSEDIDKELEKLRKKMLEEFGMDELFKERLRRPRSVPRLPRSGGVIRVETNVGGLMTITVSELRVEFQSLTAVLRAQLGIEKGAAAIKRLSDESPLKKIGLRLHDVILEVNDRKISDVSDLANAFGSFGKGDKAKIRLMRGGDETIVIGTWGSDGELLPKPQSVPEKSDKEDEPEAEDEEKLKPLERPERGGKEKPKKRPKRRYF
ncbi:MAG: HEAT repeat domain-containing protein [Planctomycetota bacterium]|jgi:hypothetical protein